MLHLIIPKVVSLPVSETRVAGCIVHCLLDESKEGVILAPKIDLER